jgi:hypothetical protein
MSCKVYLVPEDVIHTWRAEQRATAVDKPIDTSIAKLDSAMNETLKTNISDYDKEKLFTQQLNQYLDMRDQKYDSQPENYLAPHMLTSIPKNYQSKAKGLLQYLHADKDVHWDESGQLHIGQQKIDNSHIIDLIHDAMRQRKKAEKPKGWKELSQHLQSKNVPKELIGNPEWQHTPKTHRTLDERFTPVQEFKEYTSTPKRKIRKSKILGHKKIKEWINLK